MEPADAGASTGEKLLNRDASTGPLPGDPVALELELVPRFWGRLRVFAQRRVGDLAAAEDVAQETLRRVGAAIRAGRVEQPAALPAFVFQTARNICLHLQRGAGREARALSRASIEQDPQVVPRAPPDPLSALVAEERRAAVREGLGRLDAADAELLRLAYYEQLDAAEIAKRTRTTAGAIRVRKHRALRRLADHLSSAGRNVDEPSGTS
jgi:RNA polymerase sigma factor (sigma-70 family)